MKCVGNDTHVYWNKPIPNCERKFIYIPKLKQTVIYKCPCEQIKNQNNKKINQLYKINLLNNVARIFAVKYQCARRESLCLKMCIRFWLAPTNACINNLHVNTIPNI